MSRKRESIGDNGAGPATDPNDEFEQEINRLIESEADLAPDNKGKRPKPLPLYSAGYASSRSHGASSAPPEFSIPLPEPVSSRPAQQYFLGGAASASIASSQSQHRGGHAPQKDDSIHERLDRQFGIIDNLFKTVQDLQRSSAADKERIAALEREVTMLKKAQKPASASQTRVPEARARTASTAQAPEMHPLYRGHTNGNGNGSLYL